MRGVSALVTILIGFVAIFALIGNDVGLWHLSVAMANKLMGAAAVVFIIVLLERGNPLKIK